MKQVLAECVAVAALGALGALARFAVSSWIRVASFPVATLVINLSGCVLLGWFYTFASRHFPGNTTLRLAVGLGFVGAYTTFSTYMFESRGLLADGSFFKAALYILGSVALGLVCVQLGVLLGQRL